MPPDRGAASGQHGSANQFMLPAAQFAQECARFGDARRFAHKFSVEHQHLIGGQARRASGCEAETRCAFNSASASAMPRGGALLRQHGFFDGILIHTRRNHLEKNAGMRSNSRARTALPEARIIGVTRISPCAPPADSSRRRPSPQPSGATRRSPPSHCSRTTCGSPSLPRARFPHPHSSCPALHPKC